MILYLDIRSLLSFYVPETESATVKRLADALEVIATSRIAYAEAKAAFARKRRERGVSPADYRTILQDFDHDWENYFVVDVSDALVKLGGLLAEKHALSGFDAIHPCIGGDYQQAGRPAG